MTKNIKILLSILSMSFLTSCIIGHFDISNFTYLNQQKKDLYLKNEENQRINKIKSPAITNEQVNAVLIFIEGEKLDFEFEKIGLIEIKSAENSFDEDLIFDLKKEAVKRDCDAIINLNKNYTNRESGDVFGKEPLRNYSSKTYIGVAVKIIKK